MSAALIRRLDDLLAALCERLPQQAPGEVDLDPQRRLAASIAFYDRVVNSPHTKIRDRLAAQARIDRLLGLDRSEGAEEENPFAGLGEIAKRVRRRIDEKEAQAARGES